MFSISIKLVLLYCNNIVSELFYPIDLLMLKLIISMWLATVAIHILGLTMLGYALSPADP